MIPILCRPGGGLAFVFAFIFLAHLTPSVIPPSWANSLVQVHESDVRHLQFSVRDLDFQWKEINLEAKGTTLFDPKVAGMVTSGEPGHVRTPGKSGWLVVPPGTMPKIRIIEERWENSGAYPLLVQPVPVLVQGADPDFKHMGEILILLDEDIPATARIPGEVKKTLQNRGEGEQGAGFQLGEMRWWRGHQIISWHLNPLRHDGRVGTENLVSGRWEILFEANKNLAQDVPAGHRAKFQTKGDAQFQGLFLNANVLNELSTVANHLGLEKPQADKSLQKRGTLLGDTEGRLGIPTTRLYRVTAARLRSLGIIPTEAVAEDQIRLYQRRYLPALDDGSGTAPYAEIEVPIRMVGNGGEFSDDDFFVFYGLRPRDDVDFTYDFGQGAEPIYGCGDNLEYYNSENIYWVAAAEPPSGESWARMEVQTLSPAGSTPLSHYRRQEHIEEQGAYRKSVPNLSVDRLYWNSFEDEQVSVGFSPLWSPLTSGNDVTFSLLLNNRNAQDAQTLDFELITDNSLTTSLGQVEISAGQTLEAGLSSPASAFAGDTSKLVVTNAAGGRVWVYLNWVKLSYDARYEAVSNRLEFHGGDGSGPRPMLVTGFTNNDIGLIEITDPRRPVWIQLSPDNIVADGDGFKLSIMPEQSDATRKFVSQGSFGSTGVGEFNPYLASLATDQTSPVDLDGNAPDLLVILHPDFREAAQRWIDHRRERAGGDLDVHVAEVQDIYDWYSGGMKDAWALKRLTTHAINEWGTWALVIIGDANENAHQLRVPVEARAWSVDYVPTHYHIQDTSEYAPEVLASDKWFTTFEAGMNYPIEDFPESIYAPWQMYSGRLPCNSVEELNTMIDKIMVVDNVQDDQNWRRKLILMADDSWSAGNSLDGWVLTYHEIEDAFSSVERDIMRPLWESGTPVTMEVDTLFLDTYLHPVWVSEGRPSERGSTAYQGWVENTDAHQDLMAAMNSGALFLHYQGHANQKVLCSEYWFEDLPGAVGSQRSDVQSLVNADRPWVFFGMGCHISDWAHDQAEEGALKVEPSLGEKFLTHPNGGASATYASSGYEYITPNRDFGEYMIKRWITEPPVARVVPDAAGQSPHRSRWMLGELMWYCEADILSDYIGSHFREMVAQYQLLGDPLMMLDAGPAQVTAQFADGEPLAGEADLVAQDVSGIRVVEVQARDEAGIDRLRVVDSEGLDLTAQVATETLPEGQQDHQEVFYRLEIPVRAFEHQISIDVFGSGAPLATDPHYSLLLNVDHQAIFTVDGQEVTPSTFAFVPNVPVNFQFSLTSGAWLGSDQTILGTGNNVTITNFVVDTGKSNSLTGSFTAMAEEFSTADRSLVLTIGGDESVFVLEADDGVVPEIAITNVLNYPNPMRDSTRFVYETNATTGDGQVRVFSVAGRTVANIPFTLNGDHTIHWNGRDNEGDGLANGTYLYRLEMSTSTGMVVSPMQRLVVMN